MMFIVAAIILIPLVTAIIVAWPGVPAKGWFTAGGITLSSAITSVVAIEALMGQTFDASFEGGAVFGIIHIEVDPLSAWFLLLMNFTMITTLFYGKGYMDAYKKMGTSLNLHWISFLINHATMTGVYLLRNSLAFLIVWEMVAVSAFLLVVFEHWKMNTLKAGINYLIQSHVSIVFLMIGFLWVAGSENSYDFKSISLYCSQATPAAGILLFFIFLIGFGLKAGFIPLHTWLPHAHPAAPAHVSGMMSGIIIKLGIYGLLRFMLLANTNWMITGTIMLIAGVLSGLYGVMLAIVQHNLKRLLAYHSIENIGIIGIGIGIGAIGIGMGNNIVAIAGMSGALLHTLNHSLFKSLLFFGSGIIYQATHTLNIDSMGGLVKQLPKTAFLFLLASLAITGLPPFNGFVSELLIYSGLFQAFGSGTFNFTALLVLSIIGLVLIGGLALLCFTKAFGIIFLGTPRRPVTHHFTDPRPATMIPLYATAIMIMMIGLFPQYFLLGLTRPVSQFTGIVPFSPSSPLIGIIQKASIASWGFIILATLVWFIRKKISRNTTTATTSTWGCGYTTAGPKLQYTASSYVRSYRKLAEPLFKVTRHRPAITSVVPGAEHFSTYTYDRLEERLIDVPIRKIKAFIGRFNFLQNGSIQFYVLYGLLFIFFMIVIPLIIDGLGFVYELIKQL